jgi:hypothetical protein
MADATNSDTITLGELIESVLTMTDALSVKSKNTLLMSASIANDTPVWKAIARDKYTEILFRALINRISERKTWRSGHRWRLVSFRGPRGGEWIGTVDIIAIRKDTAKKPQKIIKWGDLFEIILIQMKGGAAKKPKPVDLKGLKAIKSHYHAKEVVLYEWKPGKGCKFSVLKGDDWEESTAEKIFG